MSKKPLLATLAVLWLSGAHAALAADWTVFVDPTREISVIMPTPVHTNKSKSGRDEYEASDANCSYSVSIRPSTGHPIDQELPAIANAYAGLFVKTEAQKGNQINVTLAGQCNGKNWKGCVFSYTDPNKKLAGAFMVASSDKHNYILNEVGGLANAEGTKRFFNSFEVH